VLVNPAIKKALCRDAKGDRSWLSKVRPVLGHNYHFHVRLTCPKDSTDCKAQPATPDEDGCGKELDAWFTKKALEPRVSTARKPLLMSALPEACRQVLTAQ
jgi:penicillin-insensitive murein endopeptidase